MDYTMQGEEMPASSTPDSFNWDKFTQNTTSLLGASALVISATRDKPAANTQQNAPQATATVQKDDEGISTTTWVVGGALVLTLIAVVVVIAKRK